MRAKEGKAESELVTHREVAGRLGVSTTLLRSWVTRGYFPSPHSEIGETIFFRRSLIDHYVRTGRWQPQ